MMGKTSYSKVAQGIGPARGWMTSLDLVDAIEAAFVLVQRTVATPIFNAAGNDFEARLAGQLGRAAKSRPSATGPE